jgi:hypothetical protein
MMTNTIYLVLFSEACCTWLCLHTWCIFQNKRDVIHYETFIYCAIYTPSYTRIKYSYIYRLNIFISIKNT